MKRLLALALALVMVWMFCPGDVRADEAVSNAQKIVYGTSGEGRELAAYRYGHGEDVLVMGFCIHGYEDNFDRDGLALVETAQALMEFLDGSLLTDGYNWSVYVLPCMNPDGLYSGTTCNGPGRCTTTYIDANGNLRTGKGIDLNRCFPTGFQVMTNARNFTSDAPMAAREAQALDAFLKQIRGTGRNYLVDVHGWYQQTITADDTLRGIFLKHFTNNTQTDRAGGPGYLTSYADTLGYEVALLELPDNIYSMDQYRSSGNIQRVISCVEDLLLTNEAICGGNHSYITSQEDPTCTVPGALYYTCTQCGYQFMQTLPAAGHREAPDSRVEVAPTATQDGWIQYACSACNEVVLEKVPRIFRDVDPDSWYAEALDFCYAAGITTGTSATEFSPRMDCTRSQIVTFLWRARGEPEPVTAVNPFTDIDGEDYCYKAVLWAYENGITTGTSETEFSPLMVCTRSQAVTLLHRAQTVFQSQAPEDSDESRQTVSEAEAAQLPFVDVDPEDYYYEAVCWAYETGVTTGTSDTEFSPLINCSRSQIVTLLHRILV